MKYTASLPPKYRLEITVRTSDTEIFISISRDGREVKTIEDNPNLDMNTYANSLLNQVEAYARKHYESADAYDRRKTGGSIDARQATTEAEAKASQLLEQIISDAEAESRQTWQQLENRPAWQIVNLANGYRDEQARKEAKRRKLLEEARALYMQVEAWNSEADQTARARRIEAEARAKEMQAWSL